MRRPSLPASILLLFVVGVAGCVSHDLVVPRQEQFSTRAAIAGIQTYREVISPRLAGTVQCRFDPTCSVYGLESVKKHGGVKGGWKALKRIARCNPITPQGTVDPP